MHTAAGLLPPSAVLAAPRGQLVRHACSQIPCAQDKGTPENLDGPSKKKKKATENTPNRKLVLQESP